jgi:ribosomal protein L7/L12
MTKLFITVLVIAAALYLLGRSRQWKRRHAQLHAPYPAPGQGTDADVERFITAGRKMTAIKLYREIHDVDLRAATAAVERMQRDMQNPR